MNIDLHCHSAISDGTLPPAQVVALAAQRGVQVLALTDHDDTAGLNEASAAARARGMTLLTGVEISAGWREQPVHILGVGIDPENVGLRSALTQIRAGRLQRAERIGAQLAAAGIAGAFSGAQRHAQHATLIGRVHFARYLVEQGYASDLKAAFKRYLVPGTPGYVAHQWAQVSDAVQWIRAAGGTPIMAHPGRYGLGNALMTELIGLFKQAGGAALEVVTSAHDAGDVRKFAALAQEFDLLGSHGSDFHDSAGDPQGPGHIAALPPKCTPVWQRWPALAH